VFRQRHTKGLGLGVIFRTNGDLLDNAAARWKVAFPLCSNASLLTCDRVGEYAWGGTAVTWQVHLPLRRSTLLMLAAFHCATVVTSEITDQHASTDALMITR
jgi:hypothetical protein